MGAEVTLVKTLIQLFEQHRNEQNAESMKKYMKDHFPFLGIKSPLRTELEKQFFKSSGMLKEPFNQQFVLSLWEKEEREFQYAALSYFTSMLKKLGKEDLRFIEYLITTKSWWDTVDTIASKAVGTVANRFAEVIQETIDGWAADENLWLRRTAILFQLKYKKETDEELLYQYILKNADSKEFFIQKAIGWALREYSKTKPSSVKQFIEGHQLAPLSIREGSKYLS
jgi:3-methyladenine DNA glycosylase AlkD